MDRDFVEAVVGKAARGCVILGGIILIIGIAVGFLIGWLVR